MRRATADRMEGIAMEYGLGLGIPTRGPIAERGSIEAAACAETPGFSRLALCEPFHPAACQRPPSIPAPAPAHSRTQ